MSAISTVQSKTYGDFSIYKPTQSSSKTLLVQQSDNGLKMFVQEKGNLYQVKKDMIEGLPKLDKIPKEFFNCCFAQVVNVGTDYKVYLLPPLKGGMRNANMELVPLSTRLSLWVTDIPQEKYEIKEFFKNAEVVKRVDSVKPSGNFTLSDVIEFIKIGAEAISISYLCGKTLSCGVVLTKVKDQYSLLITDTAICFTNMQTNNLLVIESHITASSHAYRGSFQKALDSLNRGLKHAEANLSLCANLLKASGSLRQSLSDCKTSLAEDRQNIGSLKSQVNENKESIAFLTSQLKQIEQEALAEVANAEKECFAKMKVLEKERESTLSELEKKELKATEEELLRQGKERKAIMTNAFTLGLFQAFGGQMDYDSKFQTQKKQDAYQAQKSKASDFDKIIADTRKDQETKINALKENHQKVQLQLKQKQREAVELMQQQASKLQGLCNGFGFSDEVMTQEAISMADMGLDAVTSAIEQYMLYMEAIKSQTQLAANQIAQVAEVGSDIITTNQTSDLESQKQLSNTFKRSIYQWLAMASLGEICTNHMIHTQGAVHDILQLRGITQEAHIKEAHERSKILVDILDKRKHVRKTQENYAIENSENPKLEQERLEKIDSGTLSISISQSASDDF